MNEILESAVRYKRMAEDNSLDEQTKEYYKKMLIDTKMYLDGLAILRDDFVPIEQPVVNEIKEPTSPVVEEKPKAVGEPRKPQNVNKVKKSPVRKPPIKKQRQKPQQKVRGKDATKVNKPTKPTKAPTKTADTKEEFF